MSRDTFDPRQRTSSEDGLHILLLGEGNLTFSLALVKKLSKSRRIARMSSTHSAMTVRRRRAPTDEDTHASVCAPDGVAACRCWVSATTFDPRETVTRRYPEVTRILDYFASKTRLRARYLDRVNAVSFTDTDTWTAITCDDQSDAPRPPLPAPRLIYFNNPHMGYEDQYRHRALLSHFFAALERVVRLPRRRPPAQVVLTLCDDQPRRWDMLGAAARSGFVCVAALPHTPEHFPEYENKRHQSDSTFRYSCMVQYYFVHSSDGCRTQLRRLRSAWRCPACTETRDPRCRANRSIWMRTFDSLVGCVEVDEGVGSCVGDGRRRSAGRRSLEDSPGANCAHRPRGNDGRCTSKSRSNSRSRDGQSRSHSSGCNDAERCSACGTDRHHLWRWAIPWLDPNRAWYRVGYRSTETPVQEEDAAQWFYPYLELREICTLYEQQAACGWVSESCCMAPEAPHRRRCGGTNVSAYWADVGGRSAAAAAAAYGAGDGGAVSGGAVCPTPPPHLDAFRLGRPLTACEQAKLRRCHARHATQHHITPHPPPPPPAVSAPVLPATPPRADALEMTCVLCSPHRRFASCADEEQHMRACHGGSAALHPNMHARVHAQIIDKDRPSCVCYCPTDTDVPCCGCTCTAHDGCSAALARRRRAGEEGHYCRVCDLLFTSTETWNEHLACLSPDVCVERNLWCCDCNPPRCFVDRRALAQHGAQKHAGERGCA